MITVHESGKEKPDTLERRNRKYWLLGLAGCALFGVGDWLLGYVDPQPVSEVFSVLKAGHGEGYALWKIALTLFLGTLGVPFMMAGCTGMAAIVTDEKKKTVLRHSMLLLPVGWLLIHFTVSCGIWGYAWNMQTGDPFQALRMAEDMMHMFQSTQIAADLLAAIPLILLVVYTLRNKTALKKSSLLFTPLLWMALFSAVKLVVPATPFTNGIDTFCMNAGMMIWFVYLLVKKI
ncbi:MAG: hypothetical protein IJV40_02020 [Oscillospiraceae bacterium]|nr:hypothetical protein [Oscillospiraceae bacterium]